MTNNDSFVISNLIQQQQYISSSYNSDNSGDLEELECPKDKVRDRETTLQLWEEKKI